MEYNRMTEARAFDILSLIAADHRTVEQLFEKLQKANNTQIYNCFNQIYQVLNLHTRAEELVFYPALQKYEETKKYVEEAEEKHAKATGILEEMQEIKPTDAEFKTKMYELKKAFKHHVEEEENKIFSAVRACMSYQQLTKLAQEFQAAKARIELEVQSAMTS
jgi:hemerythrin superfamily protein